MIPPETTGSQRLDIELLAAGAKAGSIPHAVRLAEAESRLGFPELAAMMRASIPFVDLVRKEVDRALPELRAATKALNGVK